jgi:broad specificity phosphatase PhoE
MRPNKPLQLTGYSEPRLNGVALGNSRTATAGGSGEPAAERHIRWAATRASRRAGPQATSSGHSMKRIYIARHGESIWNAERRWTGHGDPPLSDVGRAQAREACKALSGHRFDAVGSSSLVRALETASIIASSLGLPQLQPIRHFDERFAGTLIGMTSAEIEAHWPGFLDQWKSGVPVEIPGGESWHAFVDRVFVGLAQLETVPGRILIVSHMGVQRAIEHGLGKTLAWYDNLEGLWVAVRDPRAVVGRRPTSSCS